MSENAESSHVVTREIITRRRKIVSKQEGEIHSDLVVWGEPLDEASYGELIKFADEYLQLMSLPQEVYELPNIDALQIIAEKVNEDFQFAEQGTGVATISRQLEIYKQKVLSEGKSQVDHVDEFDCKLPTVMLAMILKKLNNANNSGASLSLMTSVNGSHPHLVQHFADGAHVMIDYGLKRDSMVDDRATRSKVKLTPVDNKSLDRMKNIHQIHPVDQRGLRALDLNFLSS